MLGQRRPAPEGAVKSPSGANDQTAVPNGPPTGPMGGARRTGRRRLNEISGVPDASTRVSHSFHREHLAAACYFVDTARNLEALGATAAGPDGIVQHRACVTAAIFSSVAFLESSINELYLEFELASGNGASTLPMRSYARLAKLWPTVEFSPLLLRYRVALQAADGERFNERQPPYRDVKDLIRLRDALLHDQPERHDERRRHQNLQRRLRDKFAPNTLLPARAHWFPDLCLGSGCAEWALRTAEAFSDDFCTRLFIPSRGRASCESRAVPGELGESP